MFAVVEISGFQYKVTENDIIEVSKLDADNDETMELDNVMFIQENDDVIVGKPYIEGAKIVCRKVKDKRGKKIEVMKFKRRKNYKRITGHRQDHSIVRIEKIIRP